MLDAFPVIDSKGMKGQKYIEAHPDSEWKLKPGESPNRRKSLLAKAGHLLVTSGQNISTARLTAVASDTAYIGNGWIPITGVSPAEAKAASVFINSTIGRLQLLLRPAKMLGFPQYNPNVVADLMIPDLTVPRVLNTLTAAWERTRAMKVPLFRERECEVRRIWDHAVADALRLDCGNLDRQRMALHREPIVRGVGYEEIDVNV